MRVAVQMDPIETLLVERDTSLALMLEAQARGHEIWWLHPDDLFFERNALFAHAHRVSVAKRPGAHYQTLESRRIAVGAFDTLLIRQDPPFDIGYVSNTYLLELAAAGTRVINAPRGVRNIPEKLSTLHYPDLLPQTFCGRNVDAILAFAADFTDVVMKPAFLAGGDGVIRARPAEPGFRSVVEAFVHGAGKEPVLVQEFLTRVVEGDKRIFVLDGQPVGVVKRVPKSGEFRANLHVGGAAAKGTLDDRDREICARVAPLLAEQDILFAGLDVIDGRLTEINVTSPTLAPELFALEGVDLPKLFWDAVERGR
jgi:glutathione synthase